MLFSGLFYFRSERWPLCHPSLNCLRFHAHKFASLFHGKPGPARGDDLLRNFIRIKTGPPAFILFDQFAAGLHSAITSTKKD